MFLLPDSMSSKGIVGFAVSMTTPRYDLLFQFEVRTQGDLKEPGSARARYLNPLNCELNKSLCFIRIAFLRYFKSVMEKINRESSTLWSMVFIYIHGCVNLAQCYSPSLQESTHCLLRKN